MGGYLHLVQTVVPETLHATAFQTWRDGGAIAAMGARGTTDAGEPVVIVSYERPTEFSLPNGKQVSEAVQLQKFRVDSRARGEGDPFLAVRPSRSGPPDFLCRDVNHQQIGVECTALADEQRRAAYGHLARLKRRLEKVGVAAFRHLRDCTVYVYFDHDGALGMPRPAREHAAYTSLVDAILRLPVNRAALWLEDHQPLPQHGPDIGLLRTEFGDRTHAAPVNDNYRPSRFMRRMGFDLVLGFTTTYPLQDFEVGLNALIERKDQPGNDWLLISAGAPNAQGLTFPGEEFSATLVAEPSVAIRQPHSIRRVILHRWGTGDAWELHPERRELFPRARPALPDRLTYDAPVLPGELAPGRNQPCPCASGLPFKRCHGEPAPFVRLQSGLLVPDW